MSKKPKHFAVPAEIAAHILSHVAKVRMHQKRPIASFSKAFGPHLYGVGPVEHGYSKVAVTVHYSQSELARNRDRTKSVEIQLGNAKQRGEREQVEVLEREFHELKARYDKLSRAGSDRMEIDLTPLFAPNSLVWFGTDNVEAIAAEKGNPDDVNGVSDALKKQEAESSGELSDEPGPNGEASPLLQHVINKHLVDQDKVTETVGFISACWENKEGLGVFKSEIAVDAVAGACQVLGHMFEAQKEGEIDALGWTLSVGGQLRDAAAAWESIEGGGEFLQEQADNALRELMVAHGIDLDSEPTGRLRDGQLILDPRKSATPIEAEEEEEVEEKPKKGKGK